MSFPPPSFCSSVPSPCHGKGDRVRGWGKEGSISLSTATPAPFCPPGQLQSSLLLPPIDSGKAQWPCLIPMEKEARKTLWLRVMPLCPSILGACHLQSRRKSGCSNRRQQWQTAQQWHLLDGPFLLSARPISQMGKPRERQRTYVGAMKAPPLQTPPCLT